jgi:cytochrome c peroxidase
MPELLNSNFALLFWDGRENNLKNLVNRPITNHVEMGISDPSALPEKIASVSWYPKLFSKAYPNDGQITSERISECIAVFMASVRGTSSKFDRYQAGDKSAFNALEADGFNLFTTKYNCASCHQIFTNSYNENTAFSDIGLDASYNDNGRGAISRTATDNGKFRVPSLENVALTAPYMHDGRFKTLDEVIDHYSKGIKYSENLDLRLVDTARTNARAMNISASEKARLIAFLNTMTDYSMVTNTMYSNPFKIKK